MIILGGNIQIARDIRLRTVEYLKSQEVGVNTYEDVNDTMIECFDLLFRYWDDTSSFLSRSFRKHKPLDRDRSARISSRLEQRAHQTHNPERYKIAFEKARKELKVPNFETYAQAIINTQGGLSLSPQYAAIGIK